MFNRLMASAIIMTFSLTVGAGSSTTQDCQDSPELQDLQKISQAVTSCTVSNTGLKQLCMLIDNQLAEKDKSSPNAFAYQTVIMQAACADPKKDSPLQIQQKIQALWKRYNDDLTCDVLNFHVKRGSLLKFGVSRGFDFFIYDVTNEWKVDLNRIDPSDNRTVLDYIKDEQIKHKNSALSGQLALYYQLFRDAGAKHRTEL